MFGWISKKDRNIVYIKEYMRELKEIFNQYQKYHEETIQGIDNLEYEIYVLKNQISNLKDYKDYIELENRRFKSEKQEYEDSIGEKDD